ncbi:MAG: hypothetical protein OEN01_06945 [Candidatus Krumholzibacteria bacterium]|nr:hypothetical protein [Candidatus Krumholzibacteria bacterium]
MSEHYLTDMTRIRALKASMLSFLEGTRDEAIPASRLRQGADLLSEAAQDILNLGSKQLVNESATNFGSALRLIEAVYNDWRVLDGAFAKTMALAYNGYIPRDSLHIDEVHSELKRRVGEPIAALHAKLHASWQNHLKTKPWDEHLAPDATDVDADNLDANVKLLMQGDHLDVEDAVEALSGPLRYSFANYLEQKDGSLDLLEEGLWLRPEILVMNDYWHHHTEVRLLDVLRRKAGSRRAASFAQVQDLIANDNVRRDVPGHIIKMVQQMRLDEKHTFFRCLMLHPDNEVRRYAVSNVDVEGFWKISTPHAVPCATILSMLEKVASSQHQNEDFQKIFFQTVHKRLCSLTSRSQVLYARGIVRLFARLPFFMEDEYFERLTSLIDYISAKERFYNIQGGVIAEFADQLNREKDRIGTLQSQSTNLTSIPPVVLRKLARDGHFWYELSMHPMFKIARETIPHINSSDRALRVAKNHVVNQDVLRAIGKKRSLFGTFPAKIALLSNPRTPPMVSIGYVMDLSKTDVAHLLRRSTVHPELRLHLRHRLST